ncbi:hypothetical protein [Actinomadura sp. 3N508]|uniref:hypothetical protein n=1 Tax=Actinomadura sp. 3N508 TaxID=3375153 RepID=UPI0037B6DFBD
MTARHVDSRSYSADVERIFQACADAIQPCGFTVVSLDRRQRIVHATVSSVEQFDDTGIGAAVLLGMFRKKFEDTFGEDIRLQVRSDGSVEIESISRPRTTVLDQGRNKRNVTRLWAKLDEYLRHPPGGIVNVHGSNNVTISGNHGPVQYAGSNARQNIQGSERSDLDRIADFLKRFDSEAHQLGLSGDDYNELQAEAETIRAQIRSPKPKWHVIAESVRSIRSILEGTCGGLVAAGLLEALPQIHL